MSDMKLAKFLAHAGVASRRAAEELIIKGKIKVNQQIERNVARRVDPTTDKIEYQNKPISLDQERCVLLLNKPPGVVSTVSSPEEKATIMKYIPQQYEQLRLYPVGRLDEESRGLIILTNDGALAYKLTHPKFQVPRTYQVVISGRLTGFEWRRLKSGIPLKDGKTKSVEAEAIDETDNTQVIEITLKEGRYHQIRRMMEALNHEVIDLVRISHGPYELGDLPEGKIKDVTNLSK